jgi:predicted XRE-type DNA-binding protein
MKPNKLIVTKLRKFTENGEASQPEIAKACGVSQTYISKIVNGHECSVKVYDKVLDFIAAKDKEIADRKKREAKLLTPIA